MVAQEVRDEAKRFVAALRSCGVHADRELIYGSFASSTKAEDSEPDIAAVSDDFVRDRLDGDKLHEELARQIDSRLPPVPVPADCHLHYTWVPLLSGSGGEPLRVYDFMRSSKRWPKNCNFSPPT
jgi:hypothetical protein